MTDRYGICFTKTVASGNDFVIVDNRNGELDARDFDYAEMARNLCRRKFSVGADGLLVLEASDKAVFRMRVINPDGSEVGMCGNGARCSAFYVSKCGEEKDFTIETASGIVGARVDAGSVKIKMNDPRDIRLGINLGLGPNVTVVHHINTGVPHVVHLVDNLEAYNVKETGRDIREHAQFAPDGTNADFVGCISGDNASIRTYERGVEDETLACGTGVVASAVILGLLERVSSPVKIRTRSGEVLTVYYKISGEKISDVYLEGGASIVYDGKM